MEPFFAEIFGRKSVCANNKTALSLREACAANFLVIWQLQTCTVHALNLLYQGVFVIPAKAEIQCFHRNGVSCNAVFPKCQEKYPHDFDVTEFFDFLFDRVCAQC